MYNMHTIVAIRVNFERLIHAHCVYSACLSKAAVDRGLEIEKVNYRLKRIVSYGAPSSRSASTKMDKWVYTSIITVTSLC